VFSFWLNITEHSSASNLKRLRGRFNGELVLRGIHFSITPWNKRLDWSENGGSRAEVRRERKKRDTLSPANVLLIIYQKALCKDYPFRNSRDEIIVQPLLLRCQEVIASDITLKIPKKYSLFG
jgi:hypothetical protein